ncbi:MAG TPA: TolC family protein [Terriglobales bacterium]|nr:TolC family protein [Terriglobales bacterium]
MSKRGFILIVAMASAFAVAQDRSSRTKITAQAIEEAEVPPSQTALTLDEVVRTALAGNPAVASATHAVAAQRARIPQAGSLPDPTVSVGWEGNITPFSVQTGDPASYRAVTASQTLPYFGKRGLRRDIAGKEADASQWDLEAVRRRVAAAVKAAYYDYWYYDKAIRTTQQNRDLLNQLSQIAEARYRVGKGMQADVLRSQVELSMLLQKLTTLEQQRATAQARLNALMGRDPESPLQPAADISTQSPLNYSLEDLYKLARENDPEYQRMQKMVERNQLALNLAHKDYLPDLSVGYMYQQRPALPDMHGFTFTVNIPVFYRTKQREEVRQATEEELSAVKARDNGQNELYFDLKQNYLAAKASENLLKLFSQGVVPQSSLALESSMSAYQVGNVDFLTLIGNFTTVLNYETDYYRELANYQTALAQIEALTGTELTNVQSPPISTGQSPEKK